MADMKVCPTCGGSGVAPDRQEQVLELRSEGLTWSDIARKLGISRSRVGQLKQALIKSGKLEE